MKKLIFFLIVVLIDCCKQKEVVSPADPPSLTGKWVWVKRVGGFSGGTSFNTPLNTNQFIEFTASGTYTDCQFTCFNATYQIVGDTLKFRNPSGTPSDVKRFSFKQDTLLINDGCCDRYITSFVKTN